MKTSEIANKYAKALFDVTYQKGLSGEIGSQLKIVSEILGENEMSFFQNPFVGLNDKLKTINASFEGKANTEIINFLSLLAEKNRINKIDEIAKKYAVLVQEAAGITKGRIFSSVDLKADFIKKVEAAVSINLGKNVTLEFEKDEKLIAGFKVQVGSWTLDDSAQTHLKILKDDLMKRGI